VIFIAAALILAAGFRYFQNLKENLWYGGLNR
jgi:hypothetical protein